MEKIRLGRTNLMVSRLGFGGIPIQRITEEQAIAVVRKCLDLGVTYLDTANAYTTSEERIGKTIARRKRENIIIATKTQGRDRKTVEDHLKLSLKRMGIEYIDVFQFHMVNDAKTMTQILAPNGPLDAAKDAKKAGIIRHIGITSHNWGIATKLVKTDEFSTIMVPFNFIASEATDDLLPAARKHDVGFIAMKPLSGGLLENISLAFRYLFQFPDILPIPGIQEPREIEEIVQIMKGSKELTQKERAEMESLKKKMGNRFCRRCDYCQPCTMDIPISSVMHASNFEMRVPPTSIMTGGIGIRMADYMGKAELCADCGECEKRCPYHLPIREMIKEELAWYRDFKKRYAYLKS